MTKTRVNGEGTAKAMDTKGATLLTFLAFAFSLSLHSFIPCTDVMNTCYKRSPGLDTQDAESLLSVWNLYSKSDIQRLGHPIKEIPGFKAVRLGRGGPENAPLCSSAHLQKLLLVSQNSLFIASPHKRGSETWRKVDQKTQTPVVRSIATGDVM